MNFKGFAKVHEDADKAIMEHPRGHQITIAKRGLSSKLRKHLSELPLQKKDGGEIDNPSDTGSSVEEMPSRPMDAQPPMPQSNPIGADNGLAEPATQVPAQNPTTPTDTSAFQNIPGFKEAQGANDLMQQATANQANTQAQALDAHIAAQAKAQANYQSHQDALLKNIQSVSDDIKDGHIDPNHYMSEHNKTTSQKIGTAIGLLLGGIGGGVAGTENPVMKFLNAQIERDLEGQKADLGRKATLLGALQKQYGDNTIAENMYRATMANTLADKIHLAAVQDGSQKAQAAALTAKSDLMQKYLPLVRQSAAMQMLGTPNPMNPNQQQQQPAEIDTAKKLQLMKMSGLVDEKQYEQGNKELAIAEKTKAAHDAVDDIIPKIMRLQKADSRLTAPIQSKQLINAFGAQLVPLIMESSPSKRLTHESLKAEIEPFIPSFTTGKKSGVELQKQLHQLIDTHADATPTLNGLNLSPAKHQMPMETKTVNGVTYRRGPNGEAIPVK